MSCSWPIGVTVLNLPLYDASKRFSRAEGDGKKPVILYFGDHDPSGMDMTRDVGDRMGVFSVQVEVKRIALNMDQVEKYDPPENPAKKTDTRYRNYVSKHGESSWELDALEPTLLARIVEGAIKPYVDKAEFERVAAKQEKLQSKIRDLASKFEEDLDE